MKTIYICHEYGGKEQNKLHIKKIIKKLTKEYPEYLFISPVNAFGYLYKKVSYEVGIKWCLWLLSKCDEMWAVAEHSKSTGCLIEKDYCIKHNIPIIKYPCFKCVYNNKLSCGKDYCMMPKCIKEI